MSEDEDPEQRTGYGRPPRATRYRKGQSGNPRGRPRGRHRELPYEIVLGREVTIREDGRERRVTTAEALVLKTVKRALDGDHAARRALIGAFGGIPRTDLSIPVPKQIGVAFVESGCVNGPIRHLRIGTVLDRYRDTARMKLEPWIVEAALARLGDRRLTSEEQKEVVKATRTPAKVRWPDWWSVRP